MVVTDVEELKINFHAVLTSGGGCLTERQFIRDYRNLIGGYIPLLGYRDLKSLLESLGGEFYFSRDKGETVIKHFDKNTAHISALIANQKKPKSKKKGRTSAYSRPRLPPRLTPRQPPQLPLRTLPSYPVVHRSPPIARYGNPPIIPQRQPLRPVQDTNGYGNHPIIPQRQPLRPVQDTNGYGNHPIIPQRQPLRPVQDTNGYGNHPIIQQGQPLRPVQDTNGAEARILVFPAERIDDADPSDKESDETVNSSFVDIQWLAGRVCNTPSSRRMENKESSSQEQNASVKSPTGVLRTETVNQDLEELSHSIQNLGIDKLACYCVQKNGLPSYPVPPVGSEFDIFCSMSSNPSNFIVQPLKVLKSSLNEMMTEMLEFYEANQGLPNPPFHELNKNAVFAVQHPEDKRWYRGSIVALLSHDIISVSYSDYGELGLVSNSSLRYLEPRFMQIPTLAIKAKLHGVELKDGFWSMEECLNFSKLVEKKSFVSKVKEMKMYADAAIVSLQLFVTTSEGVVDVAELFQELK